MNNLRHVLALVVAWFTVCQAFQFQPLSLSRNHPFVSPVAAKRQSKTPEYIVEDDEDSERTTLPPAAVERPSEIRLTPPNPVNEYVNDSTTTTTTPSAAKAEDDDTTNKPKNLQYAALPPGTVVQIQVGDMGLARKAWKKRRRSGSPLLVPCSVLSVDRASTVRWNLIYLLEKFGQSQGSSKKSGSIRLSLAELAKRYRSHLKTSLAQQATALDFADPKTLVQSLFNERVQKSYGIDMIQDDATGEIFLQAPVSRLRAQKRADRSPVLQVADDNEKPEKDTLKHTGVVRMRREEKSDGQANNNNTNNLYQLKRLSAALRVNQKEDVDPGSIQSGSMHTAVVFDYDVAGDAGAPLITLTLNAAPRERLRFGSENNRQNTIRRPKFMLKDLKIGDGPIKGKVVRFIKKGALIDCGIGRRTSDRDESDNVLVLGLLKFNEAVVEYGAKGSLKQTTKRLKDEDEEWEDILSFDNLEFEEDDAEIDEAELGEGGDIASLFNFDDVEEDGEVEDITHLFTSENDGSLTYTDPDTGKVQHISMDAFEGEDDDEEDEEEDEEDELLVDVFGKIESDEEDDDDDDDGPVVFGKHSKESAASSSLAKNFRSKRLHLGDEVEVFVKSVAKQSNQLFFTMNSSIQGKKPKDIKQESGKEKKLGRLLKQVGGMARIKELHGREMNGIVRATSHTGDWLYVEPQEEDLPVGIAVGGDGSLDGFAKGDSVRIKLEGIDEARGQLSMKVLSKLSP